MSQEQIKEAANMSMTAAIEVMVGSVVSEIGQAEGQFTPKRMPNATAKEAAEYAFAYTTIQLTLPRTFDAVQFIATHAVPDDYIVVPGNGSREIFLGREGVSDDMVLEAGQVLHVDEGKLPHAPMVYIYNPKGLVVHVFDRIYQKLVSLEKQTIFVILSNG